MSQQGAGRFWCCCMAGRGDVVGLTERTLGGYDKKTIAADMPR